MGIQEDCNSKSGKFSTSNGDYPQELKQDAAAAMLLSSWKFCKLDYKTAQDLEKQKQKNRILFQKEEIPQKKQFNIPRIPGLEGLIGECSKPIEKQLTESDVKEDQTRLLLNKDHVQEFLYPLLNSNDLLNLKKKTGILVSVFDWEGKEYEMVFKLWGEKAYVLTSKNWINFCHDHNLEKHQDWVTLWMFKLNNQINKLCFFITLRRQGLGRAPIAEKQRNMSVNNGCSSRKRRRDDE